MLGGERGRLFPWVEGSPPRRLAFDRELGPCAPTAGSLWTLLGITGPTDPEEMLQALRDGLGPPCSLTNESSKQIPLLYDTNESSHRLKIILVFFE